MSVKSGFALQKFEANFLSMTGVFSILAVAIFALTTLQISEAEAKRYKKDYADTIRVESRFSPNKVIYVPVRRNYRGDKEVRLPTGRWVNCARHCRWTVQKEYLDFWEYQQQPFGPGYLRFNIYLD